MIDFRYHLVSIVSIFLALAVGIVLGAGPLKGDIGTRLTEQTTALRAEKSQLRADLNAARRDTSARDTFSTAVAPAVVKDRLVGKTVALVVVPGVDADLVKDVADSLLAAGAKVGLTVNLTDAWADPAKATVRQTVATPLAPLVKVPVPTTSPDQLAATVLARAILAGPGHPSVGLTPPATAAVNGLKAGELINVTPDLLVSSTSVVVLDGAARSPVPKDNDARTAAYVQLVRLLDVGGSGVVVASKSNTIDGTHSGDLVAAVRKDSEAVKVVSTVDDADLSMGRGTLVMALAQQYTGGAGQYGLAGDAKAIVPDLPAKQ